MNTIALRRLAEVNPSSQAFDQLSADADVLFLPLEAVWSDDRADLTRRASKSAVDTGYTRFQADDTVCPKVTPTFQAGRAMRAPEVGAGTTELHILRPRPGVDPRWITYAVRSKHFLDEGVTAFQGVAGLQRVPPEFVANFRVAHVSADEQRRIADFLDDRVTRIDQIITARRAQIDLLNAGLRSRMESDLRAFPLTPIRYLAREILVGIVIQPSKLYTTEGSGIPALRGLNVREGAISHDDLVHLTPDGHAENPRSRLRSGDVVVVRTGDAGSAAVVPDECAGWNCIDLVIVRPKPDTSASCIELALNSARHQASVAAAASGAMQQHFGVNAVGALAIPYPAQGAEAVAVKLASHRRQVAERIRTLGGSIALLTEYKQALITAAVTGELDITTAGSGIPG